MAGGTYRFTLSNGRRYLFRHRPETPGQAVVLAATANGLGCPVVARIRVVSEGPGYPLVYLVFPPAGGPLRGVTISDLRGALELAIAQESRR